MTLRPMLASAMVAPITGEEFDRRFGTDLWALEQKLDGHRCIVRVAGADVAAFSRPRSSSRDGLRRSLPPEMVAVLRRLGDCHLDGELVNASTGKSWDVVTKGAQLVFVAFDLLATGPTDCTPFTYERRVW